MKLKLYTTNVVQFVEFWWHPLTQQNNDFMKQTQKFFESVLYFLQPFGHFESIKVKEGRKWNTK